MFELALCVNDLNADFLERKLPKFRDDVLNLGGMFNIHRNLNHTTCMYIQTESTMMRITYATVTMKPDMTAHIVHFLAFSEQRIAFA